MDKIVGLIVVMFLAVVTLTWDASPGATGYKMYCGSASGIYSTPVDVGNTLEHLISMPGNYYCAATAYDSFGESGFSNELFFIVPLDAPTNLRLKVM